jgi:8-oxo-dGTP diphosphatase
VRKEAVQMVIVRNEMVLLEWRTDKHFAPGSWSIPGGRLEDGEEPVDALAREAKEELGIEVLVARELATIRAGHWTIYPFYVQDYRGDLPHEVLDSGAMLAWFRLDEEIPFLTPPAIGILALISHHRSNGLTKPNVA